MTHTERNSSSPATVSVIIPAYNAEDYIEETLDSVESQTLSPVQIICVDDCSTDGTKDILEQRAASDRRYVVVEHDGNRGTGAAINSGISCATGSYVQIVGNDDLLVPDALEKLVGYCEANALDLCMYGVDVFCDDAGDDAAAQRMRSQEKYHRVEHEYAICSGVDLLVAMTANEEYRMSNGPMLVRRDLLDACSPCNLEGIRHEDMYYTYNLLLRAQRCTLIADRHYRYRIRAGSQEDGKQNNPRALEEFKALLLSAHAMLDATPDELLADPDFSAVVQARIETYIERCAKWYEDFNEADRLALASSTERETRFVLPAFERARALKHSNSYRAGRLVSYIPRKIKSALGGKRR